MLAISWNPFDWAKDAAEGVLDGIVSLVLGQFVEQLRDLVRTLGTELVDHITQLGQIDAGSRSFAPGGLYANTLWLGLVSVLLGFMLSIAQAVRDGSTNSAMREMIWELPTTLGLMLALPTLAVWITTITSKTASAWGGEAISTAVVDLVEVDLGLGAILDALLLGVTALVLLFLVGLELARSVLVEVLVVLGPVLVATRSWAPARTVLGASVRFFFALALTPMVMMLVLAVAASRTAGAEDLFGYLGGLVGLIIAVFSPFIAMKLFPTGDGGIGPMAAGGALMVGRLAMGAAAGGGGAVAGAGVAAGSRLGHMASPTATAGVAAAGGAAAGAAAGGSVAAGRPSPGVSGQSAAGSGSRFAGGAGTSTATSSPPGSSSSASSPAVPTGQATSPPPPSSPAAPGRQHPTAPAVSGGAGSASSPSAPPSNRSGSEGSSPLSGSGADVGAPRPEVASQRQDQLTQGDPS